MASSITAPSLSLMKKRGEKIVCLTAYDASSAAMLDEAGVDVLLVGDSLGNVIQGGTTTLKVTLEEMAYHVRCVAGSVKRALVIGDLPFGSYQESPEQAVRSSVALIKAGAAAVKLEGAYTEAITAIAKAGIPVMGHAGMTPQSVHSFGGFKVQGKNSAAERVLADCVEIQDAGAFSVVLELIPAELSKKITETLSISTIGIGAGPHCDGQIQVWHDMLGLNGEVFKHAKAYLEGRKLMTNALAAYTEEVKKGIFPTEANSF
jgi:3-methyl-2-oxobutanoate hydroxymethyltransferase